MEIEKNGASKAESDSAQVEHYLAQIFQFETVNGNTCRFSCMLCNPIVTECTAYCQFLFVDYIKCGIFLERKSMCVHRFYINFSQLDICSKTFLLRGLVWSVCSFRI